MEHPGLTHEHRRCFRLRGVQPPHRPSPVRLLGPRGAGWRHDSERQRAPAADRRRGRGRPPIGTMPWGRGTGRRRRTERERHGRAARQGHADRHDDQAAARGGPAAPLDDASRNRLRDIHAASIRELEEGLAPELREELDGSPFPSPRARPVRRRTAHRPGPAGGLAGGRLPRDPDRAVAQQMAARAQLEDMRRKARRAPAAPAVASTSEAEQRPAGQGDRRIGARHRADRDMVIADDVLSRRTRHDGADPRSAPSCVPEQGPLRR